MTDLKLLVFEELDPHVVVGERLIKMVEIYSLWEPQVFRARETKDDGLAEAEVGKWWVVGAVMMGDKEVGKADEEDHEEVEEVTKVGNEHEVNDVESGHDLDTCRTHIADRNACFDDDNRLCGHPCSRPYGHLGSDGLAYRLQVSMSPLSIYHVYWSCCGLVLGCLD